MSHSVPARDDEPQWKTMLRRQRLSVDRVGEEHLVAIGLGKREAALVLLLDVALNAAIHAREHHGAAGVHRLGFVEQRIERGAGPLRSAHGFSQPWLAHLPRREPSAPVARALKRRRKRYRRPGLDLFQDEPQTTFDPPADSKSPFRGIDGRDVEMWQQVGEARW